MKTIAIYLPQFHQVEENNKWWGNGFTDWVTVRNAKSLYEGHRQPRVPLDQNYYDLLNYDVMQWQAGLAKKYHVDGFCFYHYWFQKGRRILEKPAENLLQWTDIDMPFCFSWANQTWARTWTNIRNSNAWNSAGFEKGREEDGILLRQSYGGKKEWEEHFRYLLPFFQDSRYIQYDGKPVFLIYKPEYMYCLDNMMEYWKELAVQSGLKGLCIITVRSNCNLWNEADYWLMQEFDYSYMPEERIYRNGVWTIPYEDAWKNVLERARTEADEKAFLGGFIDVDDTPRRGGHGVSIGDASPAVFEKYFAKIAALAAANKKELIFVNAWNEWGEGAYMEPDEDFQYGYLEAIKRVMDHADEKERSVLDINDCESTVADKGAGKELDQGYTKIKKYYQLLSQWLHNLQHNKKMEQVLAGLHINSIAIYGMGDFGRHLVTELADSSIAVNLCFDKRAEFLQMENAAEYIRNTYPCLDAVIVTPILEYKEIRLYLKKFFDIPIMSLEELIAEAEIL